MAPAAAVVRRRHFFRTRTVRQFSLAPANLLPNEEGTARKQFPARTTFRSTIFSLEDSLSPQRGDGWRANAKLLSNACPHVQGLEARQMALARSV